MVRKDNSRITIERVENVLAEVFGAGNFTRSNLWTRTNRGKHYEIINYHLEGGTGDLVGQYTPINSRGLLFRKEGVSEAILEETSTLAYQVKKLWDMPQYPISWNEEMQEWTVGVEPKFVVGMNPKYPSIMVDFIRNWSFETAWSIPFKGKITPTKVIKAIKACINIYETEEI